MDNSTRDKLTYMLYVFESEKTQPTTPEKTVSGIDADELSVTLSKSLLPNTWYNWFVEVVDEDGNHVLSDTLSFKTKENTAPEFPSNGRPNNETVEVSLLPSKVNLNWNCTDVDGDILKYNVYLKKPGTTTFSQVAKDISVSNIDVTVSSEGAYSWYVEAYDPHGGYSNSNTWIFNVKKK